MPEHVSEQRRDERVLSLEDIFFSREFGQFWSLTPGLSGEPGEPGDRREARPA